MYYRISPHIALRSWPDAPCAYYEKNRPFAFPLKAGEYMAMTLCDGQNDLKENDLIRSLLARNLIRPCEKGQAPDPWSRPRKLDHVYLPRMNLMITGKCNYNCLHCFNAADNAPLMDEWSFEEICDLLDQCRDCGIHAFTITGGEPMVHRRFMDILREIIRRDMFVEELNTNGYFLTEEMLDAMREMGCDPLIKISFDGLGWHDWMRNRPGAQEHTLAAMQLCLEKGFHVKSQTQVNRRNIASMLPTARLLDQMGIDEMRIIRTTEVPRWARNAKDATLEIQEYYGKMLDLAREISRENFNMNVDIWQFLHMSPSAKCYEMIPVMMPRGTCRPGQPACGDVRRLIAVTASGEAVPCLQMSGLLLEIGKHFENLHRTPLKDILSGGDWLHTACCTVQSVRDNSPKCGSCPYFEVCAGGCRAMGMLYSDTKRDYYGADPTKCLFFENGWHRKIEETLPDWENLSPV